MFDINKLMRRVMPKICKISLRMAFQERAQTLAAVFAVIGICGFSINPKSSRQQRG